MVIGVNDERPIVFCNDRDTIEGMNVTDEEAKDRVAANIRQILEERGLSGRALARMTGDTAMRINTVMRGEVNPNIGVLARIAAALQTTVDYLVMHEPKNSDIAA
jgi:ribosome-binding protein aMBF1 (putative translation factor)